jgi:hypothetical protein
MPPTSLLHLEYLRLRERRLARQQARPAPADSTPPAPAIVSHHFAHRDTGSISIDLFWDRDGKGDTFRVSVTDWRFGRTFVLSRTTGAAALDAFYHPFAA